MNRNLKIFFANSTPFGIFIGTLHSLLYGLKTGVISGLVAGFIFGFLMFIILGVLQSRAVGKISHERSEEAMDVYHARDIRLQCSYDRAFEVCAEALDAIQKCRIQTEDRARGTMVATTPVNWKTWGDTILFTINRISNDDTQVSVSSRPSAWTTIVDYGKNLENVEKILASLKKHNKREPVEM